MSSEVANAPAFQAKGPASIDRGYWRRAGRDLRRDPIAMVGLALVTVLVLVAVLAPVLAPHDPVAQYTNGLGPDGGPVGSSSQFLLGTDALGRDEVSRLMYGARVSLAVGVGANLLAAIVGIALGGTAGLAARPVETAVMRLVDVILSFPILLLAIVLLTVTPPNVLTILIIIGLSFGAYLARVVYSQVTSLREREFVLAARTGGVRNGTILVRHIVPHVLPSVLVFSTLGVASAVLLEASLAYVGIGIRPPTPSWGNMISDGQQYLFTTPRLVIYPCATIVVTMIGFSLLGDGLRDALDPTLERRLRPAVWGIR